MLQLQERAARVGAHYAPLEVQRAGRRAMSAAEFLRGMPGLMGHRFISP